MLLHRPVLSLLVHILLYIELSLPIPFTPLAGTCSVLHTRCEKEQESSHDTSETKRTHYGKQDTWAHSKHTSQRLIDRLRGKCRGLLSNAAAAIQLSLHHSWPQGKQVCERKAKCSTSHRCFTALRNKNVHVKD